MGVNIKMSCLSLLTCFITLWNFARLLLEVCLLVIAVLFVCVSFSTKTEQNENDVDVEDHKSPNSEPDMVVDQEQQLASIRKRYRVLISCDVSLIGQEHQPEGKYKQAF